MANAAGLTGAETGLGEDVWLPGDGVRLHAVTRGRGPTVVLLHGFPDCWYGWRHQLPALEAAGYRAVAVDLRGYNLSDRPPRVADYRIDRLVEDVRAATESLGGPVHVVGHDWGGAVAWRFAARHPGLLDRLAILNAPHPRRFARLLRTPAQAGRLWYIAAAQVPLVPEVLLGLGDARPLLGALRSIHRRRDAITDLDSERYRSAFGQPGAIRAALAYYRAAARSPREELRQERDVRCPALVLWGPEDPALLPENADGLAEWVPNVRVERLPGAGHFVQVDAHERVNDALVRFFRGEAGA